MSQSEQFGEAWAHIRDHAKPVRPDDVFFLDAARQYAPPSKAHVKRLKKTRPEIVPDRPRPVDAVRLRHNEAASYGHAIAAMLGKSPYKPDARVPSPRVYIEPVEATGKGSQLDPNMRLRRDHMIAMSKMVYRDYNPSDAEVVAVFGSIEAWHKARNA